MLANPSAYPLPLWHPPLNDMTERRSFWSPGLIFTGIMLAVMCVQFVLRVCKKTKKAVRRSSQIYNPTLSSHEAFRRGSQKLEVFKPVSTRLGVQHIGDTTTNPLFAYPLTQLTPAHTPTGSDEDTSSTSSQQDVVEAPRDGSRPNSLTIGGITLESSTDDAAETQQEQPRRQGNGGEDAGDVDTNDTAVTASMALDEDRDVEIVEMQNQLPHRRYNAHVAQDLHANHVPENPMYEHVAVSPNVPITLTHAMPHALGEKTASRTHAFWHKLMHTRIPGTQWTSGNLLFCFLYIAANVVALFVRCSLSSFCRRFRVCEHCTTLRPPFEMIRTFCM